MRIAYTEPKFALTLIPPAPRHNQWYDDEMTSSEITALVQHQGWLLEDGFKIASVEGIKHDFFGYKSGGHQNISNLYHEVAHMMDFYHTKPERVSFVEYGFEYTQVEHFGELYDEPETIEGIERELRTFAIEFHLSNDNPCLSIDRDFFIAKKAGLCRFLADFINILATRQLDPAVVGYKDQPRIDWCAKKLDSMIDNYDGKALKAQWPDIMKRLRESTYHEHFSAYQEHHEDS